MLPRVRKTALVNRSDSLKYEITLMQAAVLLWHLHSCIEAEDDDYHTVSELSTMLERGPKISVNKRQLESLLYACNRLNERKEFKHPKGLKFDEFLRGVLKRGERLHLYYGWIEEKKRENSKASQES